ncbi:hypothetical protein N5P37_008364 [Trichoderma harzianum]|nr:hypothetical protein N5P37_008364 [Trichoderma harzianum]
MPVYPIGCRMSERWMRLSPRRAADAKGSIVVLDSEALADTEHPAVGAHADEVDCDGVVERAHVDFVVAHFD